MYTHTPSPKRRHDPDPIVSTGTQEIPTVRQPTVENQGASAASSGTAITVSAVSYATASSSTAAPSSSSSTTSSSRGFASLRWWAGDCWCISVDAAHFSRMRFFGSRCNLLPLSDVMATRVCPILVIVPLVSWERLGFLMSTLSPIANSLVS
jgi:hypothetical protein